MEDLSMDKAVEILKGKHVSRRGRRPRKAAAEEETALESSDASENSLQEGLESSPSQNGSLISTVSEEQENTEMPQEKPKRKYVRKSKQQTKSESLPKEEVSGDSPSTVNGPDPVIKKKGRGRPKKNVEAPELLLAQVSSGIHLFFGFFFPLFLCSLEVKGKFL